MKHRKARTFLRNLLGNKFEINSKTLLEVNARWDASYKSNMERDPCVPRDKETGNTVLEQCQSVPHDSFSICFKVRKISLITRGSGC